MDCNILLLNSCLGHFQKDLKRRQFCVMTIEVLLKVFKLFGRIEERQKENSLHFEMQLVLCKRRRGINSRQTVVSLSLIISLSKNHCYYCKIIVLEPSLTIKNFPFETGVTPDHFFKSGHTFLWLYFIISFGHMPTEMCEGFFDAPTMRGFYAGYKR